VGLRYVDKGNGAVEIAATGDPSFLHPDFQFQPVYDFLKKQNNVILTDQNWKAKSLGMGWAWDDYESDYMAERSMLPIYGNVVHFNKSKKPQPIPAIFNSVLSNTTKITNGLYGIKRQLNANQFSVVPSKNVFTATDIPFYTGDSSLLTNLLQDTLKTSVRLAHFTLEPLPDVHLIHTQPTDSLLKIMMHRSDNFFAEQSLLMVSNQLLGEMSSGKIIDSLLNSDLKDLPQKPKWVDGSGLSRYNLFTPQDFVAVLLKMKTEFAWDRITTILASGGSGTLGNYYKNISGKIYAKTGSLSNNVALSGYLITKSGKTLIFSVLVSNYMGSGPAIRKNVETFLTSIIENQ
jgi:D-alanyl-D-alanine carboxypeptidase/D-alanyl-D-alanine-endopeptidase (penicillin-binding protein 4)